jgi:acetyl coenzyme A synthetase (ADP forming)-like protein
MQEIPNVRYEVILRDGGSVVLRSTGPQDRPLLREFFSKLSPAATRYRFLGNRSVTEADIERMTAPPSGDGAALAALLQDGDVEHVVGVAEICSASTAAVEVAPRRAEFAVAVADEFQGRGIGTLLLERLAVIGRAAGFTELEADVLGDNHAMRDVFSSSGFTITETRDGGVLHIVLPFAKTDKLVAASFERERIAARESVRPFFEPRSVAVVGASRREGTIGRALVDNLVSSGFRGRVYPINPNAAEIAGVPCLPTLAAIGAPVDLVVIAVPAAAVEATVRECARIHAKALVVISSGFAEVSAEGRLVEQRLRQLARSSGMRLVGPNCMGVLNANPSVSLNATFAPEWPPAGNVSMLSQSGALGIAILDYASKLNIGIAEFVSIGNKADVSGNDLLSYWADDPTTAVIALYLESFGNARKFARLAPEVARKKPIVAVKSGRSAAGSRAASSHSAALASLDVGIDALFAQSGVIRTNTLEELFDVVELLSTQPVPRGPRVGVVTNAGGPGILLADACEAHGLSLPSLTNETLAELRRFLPPQAGLSNPIDMVASATPEQYERTIELVARDPNVDALVVIYIPPLVTKPEEVAAAIARGAGTVPAEKPIASVFLSSKGAPPVLSSGPRGKIPSYSFPENAAMALGASVWYGRFRERPRGDFAAIGEDEQQQIRRIVERTLRDATEERTWLSTESLARVLSLAGISFAPVATSSPAPVAAAEASTKLGGYPVVLKAIAPGLVHKSDLGGVAIGLHSTEAVLRAAESMLAKVKSAGHQLEGFLVQRQIDGGIEALVGVTVDPSLGPILVAGLGGVQVELLGDVSFRLPPVSDVDAREMLERLKAKKLFDGFRGSPPGDREALVDVITRVSALVEIVPELTELDLNPVKVLAPGRGSMVVDGRLRLAQRSPMASIWPSAVAPARSTRPPASH